MAKNNTNTSFWAAIGSAALYKRNQGRLARQLTAAGVGLIVFYGLYTLSQGPLADYEAPIRLGIPFGIAAVAAWAIFRLVHWPPFADFLIAVEAEMDKVSWPSKEELHRSTIVVLFTMFFLAFALFSYDLIWAKIFKMVGILRF